LLLIVSYTSDYVVLYSPDRMQTMDINEIKNYLDEAEIPYRVADNKMLLVPKNREHQIRMELAFYGLPKMQPSKGYELFDTNTWIKGEKELQILELRALKGQLEHDIAQFENIRSANVTLDIPMQRAFGGPVTKPKASVILNLRPGARINSSEIRAITYHLVGAVKGLTPNMVSIADTTGKLYQGIDPDGSYDSIRTAELAVEEYLKSKIDGLLSTLVGYDNFYSTVQITMNRDKISEERKIFSGTVDGVNLGTPVVMTSSESGESPQKTADKKIENDGETTNSQYKRMAVPVDHVKIISSPGKIDAVSVAVAIDDKILGEAGGASSLTSTRRIKLKQEIENQLSTILKGYSTNAFQAVDFVRFDRTPLPPHPPEQVISVPETNALTWIVAIIALAVIGILFLMYRVQRFTHQASARKAVQENIHKKTLADLEETLESIKSRLEKPDAPSTMASPPSQEEVERSDPEIKKILLYAEPAQLALFLRDESPQSTALLIYSLPATRAAAILQEMSSDLQSEILMAVARLDRLDPNSMQDLLQSTAEILGSTSLDLGLKMVDTIKTATEILHHLPNHVQEAILEKMRSSQPELAESFLRQSQSEG